MLFKLFIRAIHNGYVTFQQKLCQFVLCHKEKECKGIWVPSTHGDRKLENRCGSCSAYERYLIKREEERRKHG